MFARTPLFTLPALLVALVLCGCTASRPTEPAQAVAPPYLFDNLGSLSRTASAVPQAQQYFDQGLRLTYGFNHQAAGFAFAEAARLDPDCAMCVWGQALVLGPNINLPMPAEAAAPAHAFAQRALAMKGKAPADRALIEALALRYADPAPADRKALDLAYANAMREVARRFPDDDDAATLFAESLMDLSPWAYWTPEGKPTEHAEEIVASLERVLARNPEHIGAIHYYIHAVEASHGPERAEPYADRLAALSPGAGHLVHMPAHVYIRVGRYHDATVINIAATKADAAFLDFCSGSNGVYPLGYVPHNWHFAAMSAGLEGASAMAMHAAEQTAQRTDRVQMASEALSFMQGYLVTPLYTQVRFGRWGDLLAQDAALVDLPYPRAIWHFARGMARLRQGDREQAAGELGALQALAKDPALAKVALSLSENRAATVVAIAEALLRGELALASGRRQAGLAALRKAAALEDGLAYTEPPDWPLPIRPYLGAALLAAGRAAEAEKAFAEDLARFPDNGWSLTGLAQAQRAQGKRTAAKATDARLAKAWQWADVKLTAARF